jgi:hypothetical protein
VGNMLLSSEASARRPRVMQQIEIRAVGITLRAAKCEKLLAYR